MNKIELLINRYLAEGLEPEELAELSEAVHSEGAPEEWRVIRDMIDELGEGEDDYDLFVAARAVEPKRLQLRRAWLWRAAAAVAVFAGVGISLYINRGETLELAQTTTDSVRQHVVQKQREEAEVRSVAPAETHVVMETPEAEEAAEPAEKESASPQPVETPKERPATPSAPAVEKPANEQLAEVTVVDQRRIYSNNLLDEVPE